MTGRARKWNLLFVCFVFRRNISKYQALVSIERNILMFAPVVVIYKMLREKEVSSLAAGLELRRRELWVASKEQEMLLVKDSQCRAEGVVSS